MKPLLAFFSSPEKWSKYVSARDKYGRVASQLAPEATSFCLAIGISRCYPQDEFQEVGAKLRAAMVRLFPDDFKEDSAGLIGFNDCKNTTYERLVALLTEAQV